MLIYMKRASERDRKRFIPSFTTLASLNEAKCCDVNVLILIIIVVVIVAVACLYAKPVIVVN